MALWSLSHDVEYYAVQDTYAYYRCNSCESLSISPVPEERLTEIYPSTYYSFAVANRRPSVAARVKLALDRRLFRSIFARLGAGAAELSALDIGGGTGWLLDEAKKVEPRLKRTMVVDIDERARDAAREAGHEYFHGRIEDFATADRFDVILMLNLIEHVRDPVGVLAKAASMLAPRGIVLVKTPNYDSLDARIFRHRDWGGYHCPRHWVLFSAGSFTQAARRAELRVEELRLTQGAPFWAASVINWMKERGWTNVSYSKPITGHRLYSILIVVFAAFDFIRMPFMNTSQMFIVLRRA